MLDGNDLGHVVTAVGAAGGGLLLGLVLRALFGLLLRRAHGTSWSWDDIAWRLLQHLAVPLATVGGLWIGLRVLALPAEVRSAADAVLLAVAIVAASLAAASLAADTVRSVALARSGVAQSASIFVNITRIVVLTIGLLVLLGSLNIAITPLLTALGVGGLAVALALQDTLSNLFAGVHILVSRKVQPGDYVRLDSGEEGYIVDINWRNTTVRQLGGNLVLVPNARFADAIVTNFHRPERDLSVLVPVGVGYGSDLEHVEKVTTEVGSEVMATVTGGVPEHEPLIRFHAFGDSSIDFNVILRASEFADQYRIVHEFIKRLHARYRAEGIEIPFPIRTIVTADRTGQRAGADVR